MAADYQTSLNSLLDAFNREVASTLGASTQRVHQELHTLQTALERQFDSNFSVIEKNLSIPFNRTLPWDWVFDSDSYYDVDVFLDTRQLRYRGDPSFLVTATQYYLKYCAQNTDILKELGAVGGFYVPLQPSKLFAKMGKEVVERSKRLLHVTQIKKCEVPIDQIDVAWAKEASKGLDDLIHYLPGGAPITKTEKEFYLDIANTIRGDLLYRPIKDLSPLELQQQEQLRTEISSITDQLASLAARHQLSNTLYSNQWANWDLDVTQLLLQHQEEERKLEEMQAEAAPAERSLRIEEEAVRRVLALDSQRPDME